jgi:hypothetical protein
VIADYDSDELDFSDPATFRDLSKPMGAIGERRAMEFQERFEVLRSMNEMPMQDDFLLDDGGDSAAMAPPFHYGAHYSCAGFVVGFLLRLEPFTRHAIHLQGGRFDVADRMFRDVKASWLSASQENLQDVRELIPEFYYLPDFLENRNNFHLGETQKGLRVDSVILPPWASNDPVKFITMNRAALESKYVSENLNNWIDLIFGMRQQGEEALQAQNLFVHITYEGAIDIDEITDTIVRDATLAQIRNFGVTPSQLFYDYHTSKRVPKPFNDLKERMGALHQQNQESSPQLFEDEEMLKKLSQTISFETSSLSWLEFLSPPLALVGCPSECILRPIENGMVTKAYPVGDIGFKDKLVTVPSRSILIPPTFTKYIEYGSLTGGITIKRSSSHGMHIENDRIISSHEMLHPHPIQCCFVDPFGPTIVTGSLEGTVSLWRILKASSHSRRLLFLGTMLGHSSTVLSVASSHEAGIIVSGGQDRKLCIWDFNQLSCLAELTGFASSITSVSISPTSGIIFAVSGDDLKAFSRTGRLLAHASTSLLSLQRPSIVVSTKKEQWQEDGVVCITGDVTGNIILWKMVMEKPEEKDEIEEKEGEREQEEEVDGFVRVPRRKRTSTIWGKERYHFIHECYHESPHHAKITSIFLTPNERELFIGDEEGVISRHEALKLD